MTRSLRALLERLIDYAGLFPPAALTMQDAVRNYARYRDGEFSWALGKFVVSKERVKEVPAEFPLTILGVDEVKAENLDEVKPGSFVETTDLSLIPELKRRGLRAKIRTGGITEDAFPSPEAVAAFIRACRREGVSFKATAGLHHPLRCVRPLTYEPNAAVSTMHGFVNVFMAAAMPQEAEAILVETDPRAFTFTDLGAGWRSHHVEIEQLRAMRQFAVSFGSCSFEEPINDLKDLGWL
jgi:hypothetical protein